MSFMQFLKESEGGFRESAYFLHGADPYFLREAERLIKASVDESRRDFGIDVFDVEDNEKPSAMREVLDSLNTFSFFSSDRKTVIVRNVQKLKQADLKTLSGYLENPSESSTLFLFRADTKKDTKEDKKSFPPNCRVIDLDCEKQELRRWLISEAEKRAMTFAPRVADYLMEALGNDAGLLAQEIEKLALTGKAKIEMPDAAELLYGAEGVNIFEFTGAIAAGRTKTVFELACVLRDAEMMKLLGAVNWQIKRHLTDQKQPPACGLAQYRAILDADTFNKSTGSTYPLELLAAKLLRRR